MPIFSRYENIDLEIETQGEDYRAHVIASPVGQVDWTPFHLPFSTTQLQQARSLFGRVRHMRATAASAPPLDPQWFGGQLYDTVFGGEIGRCLSRSLEKVGEDVGLRIRLRLNNAPALADLPWEYLYGPAPFAFFALSNRTPIVRYLATQSAEAVLTASLPLRILVVIANPAAPGYPDLDVEAEWRKLNDALAGLQQQQQLVLERLAVPTLSALRGRLRTNAEKAPIHLLHFIGHGEIGALIFENEQGQVARVNAEALGVLLRDHPTLRLAFLNACEGGRSDARNIFMGVASELVRRELPAVIAMKYAVSDNAAISLAAEFYKALADGYPIDAALAEARKAIYVSQQSVEWGTPLLFSRSSDNQLFVVSAASKPVEFVREPFEPETIAIASTQFQMGRNGGASEEAPQHAVELDEYRIGKQLVSNREYFEFVQQQGRVVLPEAMWNGQRPPENRLDHPMMAVTFADAVAYCRWLSSQTQRNYLLPNEAEWEYAVSGVGVDFVWGAVREWTCSLWGESARQPDPSSAYPWQPDSRNNMNGNDPRLRVIRGGMPDRPTARNGSAPNRPGPPGKRFGFRVVMHSENKA